MSPLSDLSGMAELLRAGQRVGLQPIPYKTPVAFATRLACEINRGSLRRQRVSLAVRISISAALAVCGIVSF